MINFVLLRLLHIPAYQIVILRLKALYFIFRCRMLVYLSFQLLDLGLETRIYFICALYVVVQDLYLIVLVSRKLLELEELAFVRIYLVLDFRVLLFQYVVLFNNTGGYC